MAIPLPRKVIQVTLRTRDDKAGRYGRRWSSAAAVLVDISRQIRPERVLVQPEQAAINRCQEVAARATHPAWERIDGNADSRPIIERVTSLLEPRCPPKLTDLRPKLMLYASQQSLLGDPNLVRLVPSIKARNDDREMREIDRRANPEGMH